MCNKDIEKILCHVTFGPSCTCTSQTCWPFFSECTFSEVRNIELLHTLTKSREFFLFDSWWKTEAIVVRFSSIFRSDLEVFIFYCNWMESFSHRSSCDEQQKSKKQKFYKNASTIASFKCFLLTKFFWGLQVVGEARCMFLTRPYFFQ